MNFKKIIVGALVTSMILSNSLIGFAEPVPVGEIGFAESVPVKENTAVVRQVSTAIGSDVFGTIFNKLEILINRPNETDFISVAAALLGQADFIETELVLEFAKPTPTLAIQTLKSYGFASTDVENIITAMIDQKQLILDMANDETLLYSEYSAQIESLVYDMYSFVPFEVTDELGVFDRRKLLVFQELLNEIIDDKIGLQRRNTITNVYSNKNFALTSATKTKLYNKLISMYTGPLEDKITKCTELADVFYEFGNVMIEITERALYEAGEFEAAFSLAVAVDMIITNDYTPTTGRGSTGGTGGTGGAVIPPATYLDTGDAQKVEDIKNLIIAFGKATTIEVIAAIKADVKAKTDALIKGIVDIETSTNADKQLMELNKTISNAVKILDSEDASNAVIQFVGLMDDASGNPNVSQDEGEAMVKDFILTTLSNLVNKENISEADLKDVKESVLALVNKLIENASTLEILRGVTPAAAEDQVAAIKVIIKISDPHIASAIAEAVKTSGEMIASLVSIGLNDISEMVLQNINIQLPDIEENEDVLLGLDATAIASLGQNNVGVTVEVKGISFMVPAELVKAAKTGMSFELVEICAEFQETLTDVTYGGTAEELMTMDLTVRSGTERVEGGVELSFSLEDLIDVNLDELMVGVFENGQWTKLRYEVIDDEVVFTAPHFSVYSLMKYNTTFNDVSSHWAYRYINSLTSKGIVSGRNETTFDPQGTITRAEFITILANYLELSDDITSNYKDVEVGTWYYNFVARAALNNITAGTVNGNFRPNDAINREEMAVMLVKAYQAKYGFALTGTALPFLDDSGISEYAKASVYAAKANGIISGYEDNTFKPLGNATRAEASTIIYMFLQK